MAPPLSSTYPSSKRVDFAKFVETAYPLPSLKLDGLRSQQRSQATQKSRGEQRPRAKSLETKTPLGLLDLPDIPLPKVVPNTIPISAGEESSHWNSRDVGYFVPNDNAKEHQYCKQGITYFTNVYAFVNHLRGLAVSKPQSLIRNNLHSCLREKALDWYALELTVFEKSDLHTLPLETGWFKSLLGRFKPLQNVSLHRFRKGRYTVEDAEARRDPVRWAHNMLRHAQAAGYNGPYVQLRQIWYGIDLELQWPVKCPTKSTSVSGFMKELDDAYLEWCHEGIKEGSTR